MSKQGFWIPDGNGGDKFVLYEELDSEVVQDFVRPIGGFIFEAELFKMAKLSGVPFYVKDWLPKRGKSLLYAPAKTGKSYLCLQLAHCVSTGEDFIGLTTTKGSVLYVQFELGEEILQDRIRKTNKTYDNVFVGTSFSLKLDSKEGRKQLWTAMEAVEPDVLILDPLYKSISGDENEAQDIMKVLDFLDSVIEGFNCSILVIHHAGKDLSKHSRGSSVLEDWVDSYIRMKKVSKKGEPLKAEIEPIMFRHAPLPEAPIVVEMDDQFTFQVVGGEKTVKEQVAEFIENYPKEVCPKDLFDVKIGSNTSVYEALKELVKEGKVSNPERGKYKWLGKEVKGK